MNSFNSDYNWTLSPQDKNVDIPAIVLVLTVSEIGRQKPTQLPGPPAQLYIFHFKKTQIIRTGKVRIIDLEKQLFGVTVVRFTEASMEMLSRDRTRIMGYRVSQKLCNRGQQGVRPAPKYLGINESFIFFTVVVYFSYIQTIYNLSRTLVLS